MLILCSPTPQIPNAGIHRALHKDLALKHDLNGHVRRAEGKRRSKAQSERSERALREAEDVAWFFEP